MADNMIELVASLNVDDSAKQINTVDIPKLQKKIEGIKIKCELGTDGISSIQTQLANISKNSKLDIPKVEVQTDTVQSAQNIKNVAQSVETVTSKVLTLKKTLADLDNRFVKAFKVVENPDGIINAERTMAVIQSRLSSLGTVTVTGKYNDQESEDSINKIIARIEAASGEVRELNFLLDSTGQKFEYIGGSYSDKGVGKIQQDLARLSKELANFEASHKSIESGLIEPLTVARNAIIDLESGIGSVESAQKALDNLKTVAANIGSNLKSTGSSFNVFDNAANKAKNFDNTIKTLKMDIESLSPSTSKSSLVSQLDLAIERMNEFKDAESKSGRGIEWSQRYGEISSLLQNITNNLKVAQKEENAFNKEFEKAVKEEEKQLAVEQERVEVARQLREEQQHDYWQGRFEESVKGMTAENQVLKDMKKYYQELDKATRDFNNTQKNLNSQIYGKINSLNAKSNNAVFRNNSNDPNVKLQIDEINKLQSEYGKLLASLQIAKTPESLVEIKEELDKLTPKFNEVNSSVKELQTTLRNDSSAVSLENRIRKLSNDMDVFANTNKRATESLKLMRNGVTFADEWKRITEQLKSGNLDDNAIRRLNNDLRNFQAEARNANLTTSKFFTDMGSQLKMLVARWLSLYAVIGRVTSALNDLKEVDKVLTEIAKSSDVTRESLEELGNTAFKTANRYGRTAAEYLYSIQEFSRAGFRGDQLTGLAEVSLLAQSAGDIETDLANSYVIATNAAYGYKGSVEKLTEVLDRQNYVTNNYALNMTDLANATKIAGSQAAQSGVEIDEMTAALATMISSTQQGGEIAARSLRGKRAIRTLALYRCESIIA